MRQGSQVAPPSTGGRRPQPVHTPESRRVSWRCLLAMRAALRLTATDLPPYLSPALLALWYRMRSASRFFARQRSQDERPPAAGAVSASDALAGFATRFGLSAGALAFVLPGAAEVPSGLSRSAKTRRGPSRRRRRRWAGRARVGSVRT